MYKKQKKLFVYILLSILVTIFNLLIGILFSNVGTVGPVFALILGILNGVGVIFLFCYSATSVVKIVLDKNQSDLGFPILNLIFSVVSIVIYIALYASIMYVILEPTLSFL